MILVDTSVWVAALRDPVSDEATALRRLLDEDLVALAAPVRVEILSGASRADRDRLRRLFAALPLWLPLVSTWRRMESWVEQAVDAGERFGFGDLMIGAIGVDAGASVWSLDRDFQRMARLGFLEVYSPS